MLEEEESEYRALWDTRRDRDSTRVDAIGYN